MILRLLSALVALGIAVVALTIWRLSQGPLSLDFVTPYLEAALRDAQGDWRLDIQKVVLMRDLRLHARDVSLLDAQDTTVLRVPDLVVRPSLRALTQGIVAVDTIEISGAEAAIVRRADGTLGVSVAGAPQQGSATDGTGAFVEELLQPANTDDAIGFLHRVRIIDARILVEDLQGGASWSVDDVSIGLVRSIEGQRLTLRAVLPAGEGGGAPAGLDVQLRLRPKGDGFGIEGKAKAGPIDVSHLRRYWPQNTAVAARRWVTENIPKGTVPEVGVDFSMEADSGVEFRVTRLAGNFGYNGLEVRWLDDVPPATAVVGTSTFDRSSMHFKIDDGACAGIDVEAGNVDLTGLDVDREHLKLTVTGSGPFAAVVDLLPAEVKPPLQTDGNGKLRVNAAFPLRAKLNFSDVVLNVDAEPAALTVRHSAGSGIVAGHLRYRKDTKAEVRLAADLDVREARLDSSTLDWTQPPGSNGKVGFHLHPTAKPLKFDPLRIEFPDLRAHGTVVVNGSGSSGSATLANVVHGKTELDRLEVHWAPTSATVRLGTGMLDLQPLLKEDSSKKGAPDAGTPIDLDIGIAGGLRIALDRNSWMENVKATVVRRHGQFQRIEVSADLPRKLWSTGQSVSGNASRTFWLKFEPSGTGRRLDAAAPDFGALLKAVDASNGVRGGTLVISGRADKMEGGDVVRSHVKVTGFVLAEAPMVVRILTVAALDKFVSTLRGEGLHFDSLKGVVIARGDRYELQNFRAHGSSVGWTASGWVDIGTDELSIDGAVIPAYTASKVLKGIPLLGSLLGGRDNRGLFAINYKVRGALKDPKVTANPLTALTPGFLREVWDLGQ
jgi:hypothetical protein